ncbi:G-patch domain-containing protein [Pseudozyma hubeiensis]|nr:G-patch domain-containing protein [Pseudozyma hubeiensis]
MATDRLRRRLRSVSPDTLSTLTSSQLCIVGTPLPSLTSHKRDADELKPIWQQEARDEQGRRRFHGAFTGGWSAGYFNTVGSKEGWTPGSFTSSRKERAGARAKESRVEDFMDEEDLEDWKNNQQVKRDTTGGDGGLDQIAGLRTHANGGGQDGGYDGSVGLKSGEDIGYRLLKRMGWKPDQAIGVGSKTANAASAVASSSSVKLEDTYTPRTSRRGLGAKEKPTLAQTLSRQHQPAPTSSSHSSTDTADVWSDGRPLPSNFHLARQPLPSPPHFEPPPIPEGWQPDPSQLTSLSSRPSPTTKTLTPASRAALLGEAKLPGPPPNIAAYLSEKARERLTSSSHLLLPSSSSLPPLTIPRIDPSTATHALSVSSTTPPFPSDPAKQSRYINYLESQCSRSAHQLQPPSHMTRSQYAMELEEFAKIASIRPMSSTIASRFTKASAGAMEHELKATSVVGGLRQPLPSPTVEEEKPNVVVEVEKELSVAQKAAKMGNFGHLTRKVETWAPERLLCKRFGVPEPAVSRKRKEEERTSSSVQKPDFDDDSDPFYGSTKSSKSKTQAPRADQHWERNKHHLKSLAAGPTPLALDAQASSSSSNTPHLPSGTDDVVQEDAIGMGDDERQGRDTLTYAKPSIDVYKAIFASDEEESAEEDDGGRERAVARPKMQNLASRSGVVFQARSKRKDAEDEGDKLAATATISPIATTQVEKKRKKDKTTKKKSLLTFDLEEDDGDASPAAAATPKDPSPKVKPKARVRASDLF